MCIYIILNHVVVSTFDFHHGNWGLNAVHGYEIYVLWMYIPYLWTYGIVVSMFDFHCSNRGSNPSCGGKIS